MTASQALATLLSDAVAPVRSTTSRGRFDQNSPFNDYTNARNHNFDAFAFLRALDLDAVVEVHIAGGGEFAGMYTDSHSGPCPEPVWQLLDDVIPRAPNLKGVTFEFHDSYFPGSAPTACRPRSRGHA